MYDEGRGFSVSTMSTQDVICRNTIRLKHTSKNNECTARNLKKKGGFMACRIQNTTPTPTASNAFSRKWIAHSSITILYMVFRSKGCALRVASKTPLVYGEELSRGNEFFTAK